MSKKDYIDAINEIKVDDKLKKETLKKMKDMNSKPKFYISSRAVGLLGTAAIVFVLALSVVFPIDKENELNKNTEVQIAKTDALPTVGSFDNFCKIVKLDTTKGTVMQDSISGSTSLYSESAPTTANSIRGPESDYSKTNVQVAGVDEADITKTDGKYIYYISGSKVEIIDARDPNNLKISSEIKYNTDTSENFYPSELYINGSKLIVIGSKSTNTGSSPRDIMPLSGVAVDMAYPMANYFTTAKVYNIENKAKPVLGREVQIQGSYLTSRMIGDNVYFLANQYIYYYGDTLKNADENYLKPQYADTLISSEVQSMDFSNIYYFPESNENSYLNIAGFNINNSSPAYINSYLGAGSNVYASANSLYVANTKYSNTNYYDIATTIYKFNFKDSEAVFDKDGTVPGTPLNQYSMDENNGYFRIATNKRDSGNVSSNNLYVLNENMEMVGKVENLAKGEQIYAVRFIGDRAYIVTFKQTDPLFVIDLSDAANPTVLGELKIPGYSTYLQPYDATHIIGFGQDTRTVNPGLRDVTYSVGVKMALFDVADPTNPKEISNVKIGDMWTYSDVLNNPKALLFSKEKNIIAFPISITATDGTYYNGIRFQGAMVYGIDLDKGFTLKGQITHREADNPYSYDYNRQVQRILYINSSLFTVSPGMVKASDINTFTQQSSVEIETDSSGVDIVY